MKVTYDGTMGKLADYLEKHFSPEQIAARSALAVAAGGEVMADALRETVPVVTGGLQKSIHVGAVQRTSDGGHFVLVTFDGAKPDGTKYSFIAAKVENGHAQEGSITHANPFIYRARKQAYQQIVDDMCQIIGEDDE